MKHYRTFKLLHQNSYPKITEVISVLFHEAFFLLILLLKMCQIILLFTDVYLCMPAISKT